MGKLVKIDNNLNPDLKREFEKRRNPSFEQFINDFLGSFISKNTQKAYKRDIFDFLSFMAAGGQPLKHPKEIAHFHFSLYRDQLIDAGKTSATINRKLVAIRSFIKWSIACNLMDHNPLDAVKIPKVETENPTNALSDEEVILMINATSDEAKGPLHRFIIVYLFSLGLRRSELTQLRLKDLVTIRKHLVLRVKGKGSKYRELPLNLSLKSELDHYLNFLSTKSIFLEPEDYLVQTIKKEAQKNTSPIDGSTIYRIISKYAKKIGLTKRVSPHSARATAISHLLDTQKVPLRDVADFAGHSKITTTERYDKRRKNLDHSAAYLVKYDKSS